MSIYKDCNGSLKSVIHVAGFFSVHALGRGLSVLYVQDKEKVWMRSRYDANFSYKFTLMSWIVTSENYKVHAYFHIQRIMIVVTDFFLFLTKFNYFWFIIKKKTDTIIIYFSIWKLSEIYFCACTMNEIFQLEFELSSHW